MVDLSDFRPVRELEVGRYADKVFPTGFGGYLVVPDNSEKTVTVIANPSLTVAAMLKGATGMATVYSGWFDTLALVPSATERKLLVYDLDRLTQAPDIPLPGTPGPGAVTQDGAKLYLVLSDESKVAVVDLQLRKLVRTIAVHTYAASSGEFGRMARQGLVSLTIWAIVNGAWATRFWMVRAAMRPTPLVRRRL